MVGGILNMQIFVSGENLIFFQKNESAQKEEFGYKTISGEVAISIKKIYDNNYEIKIDERYCKTVEPVSVRND